MEVLTLYIPIRRFPYKTRNGLSERQLRLRLTRQGWIVWRGSFSRILRREKYPAVRRKYMALIKLLKHIYGKEAIDYILYLDSVHHGMPDFLCYHPQIGFKFVECKLGHEQLSENQIKTIIKLKQRRFRVEVHKLVEECTKTRRSRYDLFARKNFVLEKEMTLKKY